MENNGPPKYPWLSVLIRQGLDRPPWSPSRLPVHLAALSLGGHHLVPVMGLLRFYRFTQIQARPLARHLVPSRLPSPP